MNKLSLMDQVFYKAEEAGLSPILMGGAMILDPSTSPYPMDGKMVANHLAARMEAVPLMRQKLVQDSLKIGSMQLVDDPDFDVKNHITLTRLKSPGGYRELTACLGQFSAQPLDVSRPLWHYEVIEGLEDGRIAIAMHLHHAILDGVGAMKALGGVWDTKPVPAEKPRDGKWHAEQMPTSFDLLTEALRENAERLYVKTPQFLLKSGKPLLKMVTKTLLAQLKPEQDKKSSRKRVKLPKVHKTSLNGKRLSSSRSVSYVEFPLAEIKRLSKALDCSINDIALLLNSCAMSHYFEQVGEDIDFDLVIAMPINIRGEGDEAKGNKLTVGRVNLHNQIKNIRARLSAIAADTRLIKESSKPGPATAGSSQTKAVDSKALMDLFSPVVLDALLYTALRLDLSDRAVFVNSAVTNVPGSPVPMYLAGAKMISSVPMAPAVDFVGLTICVTSSDEKFSIGYHGCGELVKDKEAFVEGARWGFNALVAETKKKAPTRPKRKTATSRTPVSRKAASKAGGKSVAGKKAAGRKTAVKKTPSRKSAARKAPAANKTPVAKKPSAKRATSSRS